MDHWRGSACYRHVASSFLFGNCYTLSRLDAFLYKIHIRDLLCQLHFPFGWSGYIFQILSEPGPTYMKYADFMKITRRGQVSGVKCCPSSPWPCRIHWSMLSTISFTKKHVESELNLFSINHFCGFPVLLEVLIPPFVESFFKHVHRLFSHAKNRIWEDVNFCLEHPRHFAVDGTICLKPVYLQEASPPHSWRRALVQEDLPCLVYVETHDCTIAPKSSDYPECKLFSIPSMSIDPTSGQHIRLVSSPGTLLGALLKLSKRKVYEKKLRTSRDSWGSSDFATNSKMNAIASWWTFPLLKYPPIDRLFARTASKREWAKCNRSKTVKSTSTLCVLVTCLWFDLRPLLIIRITAATSSNKQCWAECELVGMLGVVNWLKNTTARMRMRRNDSLAFVTLNVPLGRFTGHCIQHTLPKL